MVVLSVWKSSQHAFTHWMSVTRRLGEKGSDLLNSTKHWAKGDFLDGFHGAFASLSGDLVLSKES